MDPELFPEEQGVYTYSTPGTPTLGICTGDKGPKVSSFGNQWGFISRRHRWGVGVGDMRYSFGRVNAQYHLSWDPVQMQKLEKCLN